MKRLIVLAAVAGLAVAACSSSSKSSTSSTTASPTSTPSSSSPSSSSSSGTVNMNIGNPTSATTVTEAGSSLLYPYLQLLVNPLHAAYSNVTLAPAAGGSGKGISDTIAGTVNVGGSDAYLSNSEFAANPGLMNVPIVISSQAVELQPARRVEPQTDRKRHRRDVPGQDHQVESTPPSPLSTPGVTLPVDRDRSGPAGGRFG